MDRWSMQSWSSSSGISPRRPGSVGRASRLRHQTEPLSADKYAAILRRERESRGERSVSPPISTFGSSAYLDASQSERAASEESSIERAAVMEVAAFTSKLEEKHSRARHRPVDVQPQAPSAAVVAPQSSSAATSYAIVPPHGGSADLAPIEHVADDSVASSGTAPFAALSFDDSTSNLRRAETDQRVQPIQSSSAEEAEGRAQRDVERYLREVEQSIVVTKPRHATHSTTTPEDPHIMMVVEVEPPYEPAAAQQPLSYDPVALPAAPAQPRDKFEDRRSSRIVEVDAAALHPPSSNYVSGVGGAEHEHAEPVAVSGVGRRTPPVSPPVPSLQPPPQQLLPAEPPAPYSEPGAGDLYFEAEAAAAADATGGAVFEDPLPPASSSPPPHSPIREQAFSHSIEGEPLTYPVEDTYEPEHSSSAAKPNVLDDRTLDDTYEKETATNEPTTGSVGATHPENAPPHDITPTAQESLAASPQEEDVHQPLEQPVAPVPQAQAAETPTEASPGTPAEALTESSAGAPGASAENSAEEVQLPTDVEEAHIETKPPAPPVIVSPPPPPPRAVEAEDSRRPESTTETRVVMQPKVEAAVMKLLGEDGASSGFDIMQTEDLSRLYSEKEFLEVDTEPRRIADDLAEGDMRASSASPNLLNASPGVVPSPAIMAVESPRNASIDDEVLVDVTQSCKQEGHRTDTGSLGTNSEILRIARTPAASPESTSQQTPIQQLHRVPTGGGGVDGLVQSGRTTSQLDLSSSVSRIPTTPRSQPRPRPGAATEGTAPEGSPERLERLPSRRVVQRTPVEAAVLCAGLQEQVMAMARLNAHDDILSLRCDILAANAGAMSAGIRPFLTTCHERGLLYDLGFKPTAQEVVQLFEESVSAISTSVKTQQMVLESRRMAELEFTTTPDVELGDLPELQKSVSDKLEECNELFAEYVFTEACFALLTVVEAMYPECKLDEEDAMPVMAGVVGQYLQTQGGAAKATFPKPPDSKVLLDMSTAQLAKNGDELRQLALTDAALVTRHRIVLNPNDEAAAEFLQLLENPVENPESEKSISVLRNEAFDELHHAIGKYTAAMNAALELAAERQKQLEFLESARAVARQRRAESLADLQGETRRLQERIAAKQEVEKSKKTQLTSAKSRLERVLNMEKQPIAVPEQVLLGKDLESQKIAAEVLLRLCEAADGAVQRILLNEPTIGTATAVTVQPLTIVDDAGSDGALQLVEECIRAQEAFVGAMKSAARASAPPDSTDFERILATKLDRRVVGDGKAIPGVSEQLFGPQSAPLGWAEAQLFLSNIRLLISHGIMVHLKKGDEYQRTTLHLSRTARRLVLQTEPKLEVEIADIIACDSCGRADPAAIMLVSQRGVVSTMRFPSVASKSEWLPTLELLMAHRTEVHFLQPHIVL